MDSDQTPFTRGLFMMYTVWMKNNTLYNTTACVNVASAQFIKNYLEHLLIM